MQLRLKNGDIKNIDHTRVLIERTSTLCKLSKAKLMLNLPTDIINEIDLSQIDFDGYHADSHTLNLLATGELQLSQQARLLSASCHNHNDLLQAIQLQSDFVVLSPVQKTASHPDMQELGWECLLR